MDKNGQGPGDLDDLWRHVTSALRSQLSDATWNTWFQDVAPVELSDQQFSIAAPSSVAALLLGVTAFVPGVDLGLVGVPGCSLFVDPLVTVFASTSAGNAQRGEGSLSFGLPLPNDPNLRGATLHFQGLIVDTANGRPTPVTMTNGVSATIL